MTGMTDQFAVDIQSSWDSSYDNLALFTAVGSDNGTGFVEVAGGGYSRQTPNFGSPAGSGPTSAANLDALAFPQATADWGTVIAFGLYDAGTGGTLGFWDYLGPYDWKPFTCSAAASPGALFVPRAAADWTLVNGDQAVVSAEFGGTLPSLSAGSWSGLLTVAGLSGDTFNLGRNTSGTGSGMIRKVVPQLVPKGGVVSFQAGQIRILAA